MKKILIVDDDAEFRSHLIGILKDEGYQTDSASSAKEALVKNEAQEFDVVLLDFMMPKLSGIDALMELRKKRLKTKVIMITAFATVESAVDAIRKGASDYLSKPFKIPELLTTIRRVIEEAKFEESIKKQDFDRALGSIASPIRRNILKLLRARGNSRLMEITRELGIDDHTKVVFHLKILKEAGIVEQDGEKSYSLTQDGMKTLDCLKTMENMLLS
ncbi:MAG TPA: response regulator [Nitrospirota bacterium]|nr:response regulator [Nitrospirota bacterium]